MFFKTKIVQRVMIEPKDFDSKIISIVDAKVRMMVEGSVRKPYGYIIVVTNILERKALSLEWYDGRAPFDVTYEAIVFSPLKGEVLDAIVGEIDDRIEERKALSLEWYDGRAPFDVTYEAIVFSPLKGEVLDAIVGEIDDRIEGATGLNCSIGNISCVVEIPDGQAVKEGDRLRIGEKEIRKEDVVRVKVATVSFGAQEIVIMAVLEQE
ncbi:RNA polymerase Rpb7-like protein [Aduncisulcus paluster]|uniref:RNA polymerase Rpb7-like protein n=1 Tax=Aduncisulcus paluster TaxID=2918883 RepID=A0ABQ5KPW7_9EUKA|nr:RNA polymerase Rpb7-like protein [Aduncisulcus paluster]